MLYQLESSLSRREDLLVRKHGLRDGVKTGNRAAVAAGKRTVSVNSSSWVTTIRAPAGSQIQWGRMSTRMRLYRA